MSEFVRALIGIFAAVAPLGAVRVFLDADVPAPGRPRVLAVMFGAGLALLTTAALLAERFLDWLDVSPESFQLAAGLIMLPQALHLLWRGRTLSEAETGAVVPLAAPLLAGPAALAAAMSYASRFGQAEAIGASAVVLLISVGILLAGEWACRRTSAAFLGLLGRLNGALLVIIAVELIVDGVKSV